MAAIAPSLILLCAVALAETPADAVYFLRSAATSLADAHENGPQEFLDHFDRDMPQFAAFRNNVESLVGRAEVGTTIDIVTDSGDEKRRVMELDWVLEIQDQLPRRQVVKVTIEKRGKKWIFTSLAPVDFFKY